MPFDPIETRAQEIYDDLRQPITVPPLDFNDPDFEIPALDPPLGEENKPKLEDVTTGMVEGDGAFEKFVAAYRSQIELEFERNRISGDQYAKMILELMTSALGSSLQFVLTRDQVYWQSVTAQAAAQRAQIEVVQAKIQAETAKMQLVAARRQTELLEAQVVQVLVSIAQADAAYQLTQKQIEVADEQLDTARSQTKNTLKDGTTPIAGLAKAQLDTLAEQRKLVAEQVEGARAQTMDTRTDGTTPVVGYLGKQKALLTEQVESYKKDAAYKVSKMFLDGWIAQKSIDEGLLAPTQLTNTEINEVIAEMRLKVGLAP